MHIWTDPYFYFILSLYKKIHLFFYEKAAIKAEIYPWMTTLLHFYISLSLYFLHHKNNCFAKKSLPCSCVFSLFIMPLWNPVLNQ